MKLIRTLISNYLATSDQLAYYIEKRNISQVAKYEDDNRREALKLIVALAIRHGVTEQEFESEMRQDA